MLIFIIVDYNFSYALQARVLCVTVGILCNKRYFKNHTYILH